MSYTESDVIEHIFEGIKVGFGINNVIRELITWYGKVKATAEVNDWATDELDKKIKKLESML